MKKEKHEIFFIQYCERFIDGQEVSCIVCPLNNTHCEGVKCEESYDRYLEQLSFKYMLDEVLKDFDFRNKYNNLSIKEKVQLKRYLK